MKIDLRGLKNSISARSLSELRSRISMPFAITAFAYLFLNFVSQSAFGACGATTLSWYADAGSTAWANNNNWANGAFPPATHNNFPDAATENVVVRSDWFAPLWPNNSYTLGCFEVVSGTFSGLPTTGARVMTITGDYFKNPYVGSITTNNRFTIAMAGTAAQTFENVDSLDALTISNTTSVTFTKQFDIKNTGVFTISAGAGTIYIDDIFTLENTGSVLTIPASATVEVRSGGTLIAKGGITVNGVLKINGGGRVLLGNGTTLSVPAGGVLRMNGSSGYIAKLDSFDAGTYTLSVGGSVNLNYFSISHTVAAGLNVTGTIQAMSNGDFHFPPVNGYGVTLGAAAVSPATWTNIGFFNENAVAGTRNINASAYNVSDITVNDWSGNGGAGNENDGNNRIFWGSAASIAIQVVNATAAGNPPTTIAKGSADTLFATFGFSLNGAGTTTDITSITFTIAGNNTAGDINLVKVYADTSANCVYNAGVDTQIGSSLTATGSPPEVTVTIPGGTLSLSNTTMKCIHVLLSTNSTALTADTLAVKILSTGDVTDNQAYSFSTAGGPPVSGGYSEVTGTATKIWNGGNGTPPVQNWNANNADWTPANPPTATDDCQIGSAYTYPRTNGNRTCQNMILPTGGTIDFNNTANTISISGSLTVATGYTFLNATTGKLIMTGTTNQSIAAQTTFPGGLEINKASGTTTLNHDWTVTGDLTLTAGTFLIASGYTLTVGGNININGGTLQLSPGATLKMSNGKILTVGASGTLDIRGNASQNAVITSTSTAAAYTVVVTGTIKAQYYSFSNLGLGGVTVNGTIDATYPMQNGSFSYPVTNNAVMLTLTKQIPGNLLDYMVFDKGGSSATGVKSIVTTGAPAGTLTVDHYNGDLTNCCTTFTTYAVSWGVATNTLKLTQEATGPATVNQGQTYNMGRFGFQQTQAGAFANTDLTSVTLTLTGTATPSDISALRLYYDSGCTGSGGVLLGTTTYSGFTATATLSGLTGATVQSHATSPPKRCLYVEYDISSSATNGSTLGVQITSATDVTNSASFAFNGSYAPAVNLGTPATILGTTTTWTGGAGTTAWATAGNWAGGVPTSSINCIINNAAFNPVISTAGQACKSLTIGNGSLTINTTRNLDVYGSFTNTGTLTLSGTATLTIKDDGVTPTTQTLQSSNAVQLTFDKTAGGTILVGNNALTLNNFSIPASKNFTFNVRNGDTLTLPNGATLSSSTFLVDSGGVVKVSNAQTITVSGGTFKTAGTNDAYPQSTSNKAQVTINGAGTWNFNATSGNVDLTGFLFDWLSTSGLVIGGTTTLTNLNGGQLRNLSNTYASVKAIQINTSGTIPAVASNVGWNWGPNNTPPNSSQAYQLASSTGCANHTITFDQWFGDFFVRVMDPDTQSKVSAVNCTINISASASPVNLTQFRATPYNEVVLLDWTTGLEILHQGFNVYRSLSPDSGFVQINPSLLRNSIASGSIHGSYQFFDRYVTNGVTYYYMIEDLATNGQRTMHGPLSATPLGTLANAPVPTSGAITGENPGTLPPPPAPPPAPSLSPGQKLLFEGVTLLAKTEHSLRLKIDIPNPTFTADPAHAPYSRVAIPTYSLATDPGKPELPERIVMLEIPAAMTASSTLISETHNDLVGRDIASAPGFNIIAGSLVPYWTLDSAFYGTSQSLPANVISLGDVTQSQGKTYLPLIIKPLSYNPVAQTVRATTQVILDISLGGTPGWNVGGTIGSAGPWGHEGSLKISIKKAGLYQLNYSDLVTAGVDGPFAGADVSRLKLYHQLNELPIEVNSADGTFGAGDSIVFYSPYVENYESDSNTLLMIVDQTPGLRMATRDASATGYGLGRQTFHTRQFRLEQNNFAFFDEPYGENDDHMVWGRFFTPPNNPGDDELAVAVSLPNLISSGTVDLNIRIKGSKGYPIVNVMHHMRLFINGAPYADGDQIFQAGPPFNAQLSIPAWLFVPGNNNLTFKAMGTFTPGDYDIISLDYVDVSYSHDWVAENDVAELTNLAPAVQALSISGFTNNDLVSYDYTNPLQTARLNNTSITPAGGGFSIQLSTPDVDNGQERKVWVGRATQLQAPASLELNAGSYWHSTSVGADVIYIGTAEMLSAVRPLADLRYRQGFRVQLIDIEALVTEFGHGVKSSALIKDFLQYASANWQAPALKYVVLVGDSTYDPKNALGFAKPNALPVKFLSGQYLDYPSDNWFVAWNPGDQLPSLAIGRLPGHSAASVGEYVRKVLDYEEGNAKPSGSNAGSFAVIADDDQLGGEQFVAKATQLGSQIRNWNPALSIQQISRPSIGDAQTKQAIINQFDSGAAFIHYLGHGAENMWAANTVFTNGDAQALRNTKLPIVVAMDCLNASFTEADPASPAYQSLADALLFNPIGGAIAVWASTSFTTPNTQAPYQQAFYEIITRNPGIRLGEAVRLAKIQAGWSAGTAEVVSSWTLLGDPMLKVDIPAPPAASVSTPVPSSSNDKSSGGGFLSCGTISSGGGSGGGPSSGAMADLGMIVIAFSFAYRRARRNLSN